MEYKLIVNLDSHQFNRVVNDHLDEGWQLFGSPQVTTVPSGVYFCQAVTRVDTTEKLESLRRSEASRAEAFRELP